MNQCQSELYLSQTDPEPVKLGICQKTELDNMPLAMAYVPMQSWKRTYDNEVALERGTIFPELDLPFLGEEVM